MVNSFLNIKPNSDFGNTARDNILKFLLDNEVGNALGVSVSGNTVTISLLSKLNEVLSSIDFDNADATSIVSASLDATYRRLAFTRSNGSIFYCDLTSLYELIDTKQDELVSGENIKTVNGYSVLGTGNIVLNSTNVLTEDLQTAVNSGIDANAVEKLSTVEANALPNLFQTKQSIGDSVSILYNSETDHLQLPEDWIKYLEQETLKVPVITISSTYGNTKVEYGTTISDLLKHSETNLSSIDGKLTLYRNNSEYKADISPSTTSVALLDILTKVTGTTSYMLKCKDVLSNDRQSNTITYSCYKPSFYGASSLASLSSFDDSFSKVASEKLGTVTLYTTLGQYAYFVVSGTITNITSSGYSVPFIKLSNTITVTLNDEQVIYNVYRTSEPLLQGSNSFVIS